MILSKICFFAFQLIISAVNGFQIVTDFGYNAKRRKASASKLQMVRNIDLPEAIVFYGLESMMEHNINDNNDELLTLRPGVARLINECVEVGTAALLLSEDADETSTRELFQSAYDSSGVEASYLNLEKIIEGDNQILHFRTLQSHFLCPPTRNYSDESNEPSNDDEDDESITFYNLQSNGKSPSPAFLLDSLRSVNIDPRGFGGSSGFGRGQWVEPQRSPMMARTVVFIAGDWVSKNGNDDNTEEIERSTVKDRCAASRAAGSRVIYLENLSSDENLPVLIKDDEDAISLCDAVIDSFGSDNTREIQPISLDAISTPGDYWLNPPNPRDDHGNAVAIDEIVEFFRAEREMEDVISDSGCVIVDNDDDVDEEMSEDDITAILADLDAI